MFTWKNAEIKPKNLTSKFKIKITNVHKLRCKLHKA